MSKLFREVVRQRSDEMTLDSLIRKYELLLDENILTMDRHPNSLCSVSVDPVDFIATGKATVKVLKELKDLRTLVEERQNVEDAFEVYSDRKQGYRGMSLFLHPKFMQLCEDVIAKKITSDVAAVELGVSAATFSRRLLEYREILKGGK